MTESDLRTLITQTGRDVLEFASRLESDLPQRIAILRKRYPADIVAAAMTLLALRRRAKRKFSLAERMFFTPEGLEQSTSERVARWRAARMPKGVRMIDLCCGIGADSMYLMEERNVVSVDIQPEAAFCARQNMLVRQTDPLPLVICADVTKLHLKGDAAFFDPSRRAYGSRTRNSEAYSPPLSFLEEITRQIPNVCVKLSPGMSDKELETLDGRLEFVSEAGECKEITLWRGEIGPRAIRSAIILTSIGDGWDAYPLEEDMGCPPTEIAPISDWLYEPDPAIIKGRLLPELAQRIFACKINAQSVWLTTEEYVDTPLAKPYRVIEHFPFQLKYLRRRVKLLKGRVEAVKCRGVPFPPEDILPSLKGLGEIPMVAIITPIPRGIEAILCDNPKHIPDLR